MRCLTSSECADSRSRHSFQRAFGENRPLIEAPGHLFQPHELDDAVSVLAVAMVFFWDCHVLPAGHGPAFVTSHDEWNDFVALREGDVDVMREFGDWLEPSNS